MRVVVYSLDGVNALIEVPGSLTPEEIVQLPRIPQNAKIMDISELPQDRYFRNAWTFDGTVKIDMAKARDIHVAKLKEKREKKLKDLDVEWSKALGQKKQKDADDIEAKRQALRDFPVTLKPQIDAAQTPEALKAIIPQDLADVL